MHQLNLPVKVRNTHIIPYSSRDCAASFTVTVKYDVTKAILDLERFRKYQNEDKEILIYTNHRICS